MEFPFNFGFIRAYSVPTIHMWSNAQSVEAPLLSFTEFVHAIFSTFHA